MGFSTYSAKGVTLPPCHPVTLNIDTHNLFLKKLLLDLNRRYYRCPHYSDHFPWKFVELGNFGDSSPTFLCPDQACHHALCLVP